MPPDQFQCPCLSTHPKICTFRHFSVQVWSHTHHSPQPSSRSGTGSARFHTRMIVHTHTRAREQGFNGPFSVGETLCGQSWWPPPTNTHIVLPQQPRQQQKRGLCVCWLKCWATMPWQPSLNLLSTSSPLLLCRDSHHNGCCLWTCQAAKDTKTTQSTFDIRTCHQKTRDKLSWQLC